MTKEKKMKFKANLLIISEEASRYDLIRSSDVENYCNIYFCGKEKNVFSLLKTNNIKMVIMDLDEDQSWEFKLLKDIKTLDPIVDVVIVGVPASSEKVMNWINQGATDYLIKPIQTDMLKQILRGDSWEFLKLFLEFVKQRNWTTAYGNSLG